MKSKKNKPIKGDEAEKAKSSRLSVVETDPLFHEMPRQKKKVKVDPRFKAMFEDERFAATSASVDRHGRPVNKDREREDLRNVYELEKSESGDSDADKQKPVIEARAAVKRRIDLARGEGNVSSSEDEDSSEGGSDDEDEIADKLAVHDKWGELDRDVRKVEWISRRFAVCNMDWDKLRAEDLFVTMDSFKPENGSIETIKVYLSDFGAEQLVYEEEHGPRLPDIAVKKKSDEEEEENPELVRAYQFDCFRYYYAVVTCDSEKTANAIYEKCDGVHYQESGLTLDLRFIPDDMDFDESRVRDQCSSIDSTKYKSSHFQSAITRSKAKLEWETDDFHRQKKVKMAFEDGTDLADFTGLIASGSEDDDEPEKAGDAANLLLSSANVSVYSRKAAMQSEQQHEEEEVAVEDGEETVEKTEKRPKKKKKSLRARLIEKMGSKKKKQKLADLATQLPADIDDSRFTALYTNSDFAIDRTNPNYKGGVLADRQVHEKIRRKTKE